uniref:Uncharacterized protein n=1 Tax=Anguilla anguilla TaxID=7936 RepID=A0A0E9Q8D2_ANGAN
MMALQRGAPHTPGTGTLWTRVLTGTWWRTWESLYEKGPYAMAYFTPYMNGSTLFTCLIKNRALKHRSLYSTRFYQNFVNLLPGTSQT